MLRSTREGKRSTRHVLKGRFGRAPQATACLQAGSRRLGQLERYSSACQSGAQIDQRRRAVNPAGFEARALLKRELACCSDRPEKVNCQPGLFGRACLEKQRRRSGVARVHNGMASFENGVFKGRGRSLWSARALLKRVSERCSDRPPRCVCHGLCAVNAVSCVAGLKPRSARGLVKRVSKPVSDRRKEVRSEPSMCQGAGLCNELCSFGPLHEPSVRPILVPAYSH